MSVTNGNTANATTFNNAFVSRTVDTSTVGVLTLNNTSDVDSGAIINNTQQSINELFDASGVAGQDDLTRNDYSSNNVVSNGQSRKVAIGVIDAAFDPTTGHDHDGVNSKQISAASLSGINQFRADWSQETLVAASGLTFDVTSVFSLSTPGGSTLTAGVVTDPPLNKVEIRTDTGLEYVEDAGGQRVYGRLTEAAGTWTLSFFTLESGIETAHSLSSQNITIAYREVFTLASLPTFGSDVGVLATFDLTNDIIPATATVAGKVTLNQISAAAEPNIEYRTITGGEAAAKQLTLSGTPLTASKVMLDVISGGPQEFSVDYSVSGSVLDWSGFSLDGILDTGDRLRIVYWI